MDPVMPSNIWIIHGAFHLIKDYSSESSILLHSVGLSPKLFFCELFEEHHIEIDT